MFRNLLNPDNGLMVTMAQITDCILLSLLWLLGCFPLFTVGAASAALYDSVRHCLRGSERNPVSRFLRSFLHYVPYACLTAMTFPAILSRPTASPLPNTASTCGRIFEEVSYAQAY